MKRICLECGDTIMGRSDKKFCCDTCRNAYHNHRNRDSNNLIRNTHNRLRKNYRILKKLHSKGKNRVTTDILIELGFSFNVFTGVCHSENNGTYRFVYDQGYLLLEDGLCLLVKSEKNELFPTTPF